MATTFDGAHFTFPVLLVLANRFISCTAAALRLLVSLTCCLPIHCHSNVHCMHCQDIGGSSTNYAPEYATMQQHAL